MTKIGTVPAFSLSFFLAFLCVTCMCLCIFPGLPQRNRESPWGWQTRILWSACQHRKILTENHQLPGAPTHAQPPASSHKHTYSLPPQSPALPHTCRYTKAHTHHTLTQICKCALSLTHIHYKQTGKYTRTFISTHVHAHRSTYMSMVNIGVNKILLTFSSVMTLQMQCCRPVNSPKAWIKKNQAFKWRYPQ